MNVRIKTIEPMHVAFMRHVGPYDEVAQTWKHLVAQLARDGRIGADSVFIGIPHDDPDVTPLPTDLQTSICLWSRKCPQKGGGCANSSAHRMRLKIQMLTRHPSGCSAGFSNGTGSF